jgi:hypothetical protein
MRTENPSVSVEFINHYKFQILKEVHPLCVMGKDTRMKHIRIGDHDIPLGSDGLPRILWGIPIIGKSGNRLSNPLDEVLKLKHLVLGKGFRRKEIKSL